MTAIFIDDTIRPKSEKYKLVKYMARKRVKVFYHDKRILEILNVGVDWWTKYAHCKTDKILEEIIFFHRTRFL